MSLTYLKLTLGNPNKLQPKGCSTHLRFINQDNNNAMYRNVLRESFGNAAYKTTDGKKYYPAAHKQIDSIGTVSSYSPKTTPFRVAMNAGDINGAGGCSHGSPVADNILPKPVNQVKVGTGFLNGWKGLAGNGKHAVNTGSYYTGNPKYVYDGADYVRFKKLQAINRNYNDPTFGGDQHNASQVALNAGRR
jgi:hypothetical protein